MANISRKAFGEVLKSGLPSTQQHAYQVKIIAKKLGVNLDHGASIAKYKAVKALQTAKKEGLLKSSMREKTAEGFGNMLNKASVPKGPDANVVKARNLAEMRRSMEEAEQKKQMVTAALSRGKSTGGAKGSAPSASRTQAPLAGGRVIGQAAQEETAPARGAARGMFGGERQIERSVPPAAKDDDKPSAEEAHDMFGED